MRNFYIIGFAVLLLFDTLAQTSFKMAAVQSAPTLDIQWIVRLLVEPWVYCAVAAYLGAFGTYMTLLKHAPVGPAFAATHLEIVTVLLVSHFFLGEHLTGVQIAGSVLIAGGIILLGTEKDPDAAAESELPASPALISALDTGFKSGSASKSGSVNTSGSASKSDSVNKSGSASKSDSGSTSASASTSAVVREAVLAQSSAADVS